MYGLCTCCSWLNAAKEEARGDPTQSKQPKTSINSNLKRNGNPKKQIINNTALQWGEIKEAKKLIFFLVLKLSLAGEERERKWS